MDELRNINITIDGIEISVPQGSTVLQACEAAGAEIPRFCYHEKLSVAGNCRMCLVEMERSPKPVASCAMPASDGMIIKTSSEMVEKARKGVMEFLLINHPLDCPICDQGGECDLQDQALYFGKGETRFENSKRAVSDKNMGPLIKTTMTRCIHCTRCVRFANEVAGVEDLGATGRGENVEISTYLEKAVTSELSGNLVDLCPVGALTSKPYQFVARPWELTKTESVDVMDAIGSNIRIDSRDGKVLRILPKNNESINEEWISDKSRYAIDGLSKQRLDTPFIKINNKLQRASWDEAFEFIHSKISIISNENCVGVVGNQVENEAIFAFRELFKKLNLNKILPFQKKLIFSRENRSNYLFNSKIEGLDKCDYLLLIGANPRVDSAILNARIRKNYIHRDLKISSISSQQFDLKFNYEYLGSDVNILTSILEEKHKISNDFKNANFPMIIIGDEVLQNDCSLDVQKVSTSILKKFGGFNKNWNGFNILHNYASTVGAIDILSEYSDYNYLAFKNDINKNLIKFVYLLNADDFDFDISSCFVIYQGHHGDKGAQLADVILPGAAYTEKEGSYTNLEGRVQYSQRATFPPGDAKEDWTILRALSEKLGKKLDFDNFLQLREMMFSSKTMLKFDENIYSPEPKIITKSDFKSSKLNYENKNFFMTCPISRCSSTMAECSQVNG